MINRITAIATLALAFAASPAISQEEGSAAPPTDKKAPGTDAAPAKPDDDSPKSAAAEAAAPGDAAKEKAVENPDQKIPESVKKLSAEQREHLQKLLNDASVFIGGIRIQEAFEKIIEAEELAPDLFQLHNLKGAAYTKIRDFPKARNSFETALKLNPSAFMSRFNITELDFVEHKFADAEKNFASLIADAPDMNLGTRRLIEFKILIAQLSQDKRKEAEKILESFNYLEDTPAYYFGNAAFAFIDEDDEGARGWIRSAERIYNQQEVSVYVDSFIEMGWIDNLQ